MADFDFEFQPTLDRKLVADLGTLRFIEENRPILFLGQPGCGKTHLAVALATTAVEAGFRGYFTTADDMVNTLVRATREGTLATKLKNYTAPTVLVIDDVGLLPIERGGAGVFFQVVNARYEKGHPTLVTTNRGLPEWGEIFGANTTPSSRPPPTRTRTRRGGTANLSHRGTRISSARLSLITKRGIH